MANFTGAGNYTSKLNQALGAPPTLIYELFSALNIFLSIVATLGNVLILVALTEEGDLYSSFDKTFLSMSGAH